jgi:hypothetical protein
MLENQQDYTDKIFRSLDDMEALFVKEVDLQTDVATFMKSVFLKIRRLCNQTTDEGHLYDLYKIAVIFLPRTFEAYCDFPVDVRNLRVIKDNETSRDILIKDLTLIKNQVINIENEIYSSLETKVRVNSNILKEQFDSQMHLATDTELNTTFENHFDIHAYMASEAFQKQIINKPVSVKETQAQEQLAKELLVEKKKEQSRLKIQQFCSSVKSLSRRLFKICFFGGIVIFIAWGIYYLSFNSKNSYRLQANTANELANIEYMMHTTSLNDEQLKSFIGNSVATITGSDNWRATHLHLITQGQLIKGKITGIDNDDCQKFIDAQIADFPDASVMINNIVLPAKDLQYSSYFTLSAQHPDYKLCYLNENNMIDFSLNSADLYAQHQQLIHGSHDAIKQKVDNLITLNKQLESERSHYRYDDTGYERLSHEMNAVSREIDELSKIIS